MKYAGLTDNPKQRKAEHGNPADWRTTTLFPTESTARAWEKAMLLDTDFKGGTGGAGWRYGYVYTITSTTRE